MVGLGLGTMADCLPAVVFGFLGDYVLVSMLGHVPTEYQVAHPSWGQ
jgi:hypothetical protein